MDLLEKSRNTLELPAVLEMLAGEAVSEPAKAEAIALVPSVHRAEVERLLAETSAAKDMMVYKGSPSLSGLRDVRGSLARADMGGVLNTRELLEIAGVLQSARAVRSTLKPPIPESNMPIGASLLSMLASVPACFLLFIIARFPPHYKPESAVSAALIACARYGMALSACVSVFLLLPTSTRMACVEIC